MLYAQSAYGGVRTRSKVSDITVVVWLKLPCSDIKPSSVINHVLMRLPIKGSKQASTA
jgi:hypothetical protein